MTEYLFFVGFMALMVALIEVWHWEQKIKEKMVLFPVIGKYETYWAFHPLICAIPILVFTWDVLLAISGYFLYGVLEDVIYFLTCKLGGSDTWYDKQDWMPVYNVGSFRLPQYYPLYLVIGLIAFILSIVF